MSSRTLAARVLGLGLIAALDVAAGRAVGACRQRCRASGFPGALDLSGHSRLVP